MTAAAIFNIVLIILGALIIIVPIAAIIVFARVLPRRRQARPAGQFISRAAPPATSDLRND